MKGIVLGAMLVTLLAGCASAPTQPTLVSAQAAQSLAPRCRATLSTSDTSSAS